jgi:putative transcriptional regulator
MAKMTEAERIRRDHKRHFAEEVLQAIGEIRSGKADRVFRLETMAPEEARRRLGLSQAEFAAMLGISVRTLQRREHRRR